MIPIQQLLSRIKWDREFGEGEFVLGYYDRVEQRIIKVALSQLVFETERRESFLAFGAEGETHRIPLHRVREVYRNGELIWQRRLPG